LFAAGISRMDGFEVFQVVRIIYAIDENHAWLGETVGGCHDFVPERASRNVAVDLAFK